MNIIDLDAYKSLKSGKGKTAANDNKSTRSNFLQSAWTTGGAILVVEMGANGPQHVLIPAPHRRFESLPCVG
jgi:hypothetical protein